MEKIINKTRKALRKDMKDYVIRQGKGGGYLGVAILKKPAINQDYIWIELKRCKRKGEKDEPAIAFSINDKEVMILARMLLWAVDGRMKGKNVS